MLRSLRIENFKGWKDSGHIRMAPITLFFGANSSGKSSIGQFLMMLAQTVVESQDRKSVFYLGHRRSAVNLGSYQKMVFRHDAKNNIRFEYEWQVSVPEFASRGSVDSIRFAAEVGVEGTGQTPLLKNLSYRLKQDEAVQLRVDMQRSSGPEAEYLIRADPEGALKLKKGRPWIARHPVRFYGFPDEIVASYQDADFLRDLNLYHEALFRSIYYLGPIRTKAERLYSWPGTEPESVGYEGENTIAAILAADNQERMIALRQKREGKVIRKNGQLIQQIVAAKLKEMGLIEDFKIKSIAPNIQQYEVLVRTRGSKDWVDLPDVGFGVSQVLPVLVQCFCAPPGSIIVMEQPEIHLHPRAQSVLADVMVDVVNSRENGKDRNIQLIIETHSEHFLRRIQRRIADDTVSDNTVAAYFAGMERDVAVLSRLEINRFGTIQNWPHNFFGDEMGDIAAQADAAMRKKIAEKRTSGQGI